ncbi:hypothetical protein [Pseudactinotalea terrae]|uniref:hypothetical protein n=1 Tax=Pseudactinotalea terrae TaxID=1743262 RepID=UPI0012E255D6|nr:hypothetical protein [Pseudactinotalea terrae]
MPAAAETLTLWHKGVRWPQIAVQVGLPVVEVGNIITGHAIQEVLLHGSEYGLTLIQNDPGVCRMVGCGKPRRNRGLCTAHISRLRRGYGLFGAVDPTVRTCVACGAQWCGLRSEARVRRTCGDPLCVSAAIRAAGQRRQPSPAVTTRVEQVVRLLEAGMLHKDIAPLVGLSKARVAQIAVRNGQRRYRSRPG